MPDAEMIPDLDVESGTRPAPGLPLQRGSLFFSLSALVFGTAWLAAGSTRISFLFLVGGALGASLLVMGFGFTSGYRRAILERDVAHVQAQLLMLGWWSSLPTLGTVSLAGSLGWPGAVALQLTVFVALATIVTRWSRGAKRAQPADLSETIATTIELPNGTIRGWISRRRSPLEDHLGVWPVGRQDGSGRGLGPGRQLLASVLAGLILGYGARDAYTTLPAHVFV